MTDGTRKPVSKRLRYEILRRDNHTCQYCGGTAPDVTLTIDHVTPVALGGSNSPSNLVAACKDCNAGKTSSNPDAPLVDTVADDAIRWAAAIRQASREINGQDAEFNKVLNAVKRRWKKLAHNAHRDQLPEDWAGQVATFHKAGLSVDDLLAMVDAAYRKQFIKDRWPYFYGCCRNRLQAMQDRAAELVKEDAADKDDERLETWWTAPELDGIVGFHEATAIDYLGPEAVSRISCRHRSEGDCGDPLCQMDRAGNLWVEYSKAVAAFLRDEVIMDALDGLEMADG